MQDLLHNNTLGWHESRFITADFSSLYNSTMQHIIKGGNPRCLMIAQSWETLDGLSLHNPGKLQMSYDCTILGNRWFIIAQSWETPDGLWLHNPLATYCHRDQSPCPIICSLYFFQAKLGDILYRIIEGILHSLPHFALPAPWFALPAPNYAPPAPCFAPHCPINCSF